MRLSRPFSAPILLYVRAVRLLVQGRVQGVAYRAHACEQAQRLGLRGWVRNEPEGSVAALAVGSDTALQAFVDWCRRGPPAARVARVDEEWLDAGEAPPYFEIRY
jgi:acylphosphatase